MMKHSRLLLFILLFMTSKAFAVNDLLILSDDPPKKLSEYNFFSNPINQLPSEQVVPYELITALFSDYTDKHRFVYVPNGMTAAYNDDEVLDFPVGTALIKTFSYQKADGGQLLLETRLLLRKDNGWDALTYVWDMNKGDAYLALGGKTIDVRNVITPSNSNYIRYRVPNKNQCKECHLKNDAIEPIGPKPRNINKQIVYKDDVKRNQIDHWTAIEILQEKNYSYDRMVNAFDQNYDINLRARSYLDINCGHCHSPEGSASSSGLYLSIDEEDFGIYKKPVAAGRGSGGLSYSIVPGHPDESILLYRMLSNEPDVMMPESGRTLMHDEAIELVSEWITEMK
ncbi:MAG TPA: SO2930 family diheme c-type cytochrome, partial [Gammaproteobacteria bacterium]|nr:SO2930 family diheme c-type cytochrome [Gammaproteobacteria bacterium]